MPLVKLIKGARYQFANTLVQRGEVVEVDSRTRNRLVRSRYFQDVEDHERPAFVAMDEDDAPTEVVGGTNINELNDPAITGALTEDNPGPVGSRGKGKVHARGGSAIADAKAAETVTKQDQSPDAEKTEAAV